MNNQTTKSLMRKYCIPCVISLLVASLYNIVDQIFIANANYLGSYGNAANTVVFPLTVVALAIAVMIGDGCCTYVSNLLGEKKENDVAIGIASAIKFSVVSGIVIMLIYFALEDQLIIWFGGGVNEETFSFSKEYFTIIIIGIPFYVFGQAFNPIIRATGHPKYAMMQVVVGAIINIILDPIFIFPMRMGMFGAALATIIGQIVTAILAIIYIVRIQVPKLKIKDFKVHVKVLFRMLFLGVCSFLAQVSMVLTMLVMNNVIKKYSLLDPVFKESIYSHIPMAVMGIVMKFFQIVISIVIGVSAGCIPIVGYNTGSKQYDKVKETLNLLLIIETIIGVVGLLIVELAPNLLLNIFGASNESEYYVSFGIKSFRIYLSMLVFACLNKATFIFLQAMQKPFTSTFLSMIREIVFGIGFSLLLPLKYNLDGCLYSMPVADIMTFVFTVIILVVTYVDINKKMNMARA